jgi:hypothetical protein
MHNCCASSPAGALVLCSRVTFPATSSLPHCLACCRSRVSRWDRDHNSLEDRELRRQCAPSSAPWIFSSWLWPACNPAGAGSHRRYCLVLVVTIDNFPAGENLPFARSRGAQGTTLACEGMKWIARC